MSPGATIKTDGWSAYPGAQGVAHDPHVIGKMAAHVVLPWVHRVFANVKTWALGIYHGLREKHLQSYLDEFVFRFNRRKTRHAAFRSLLAIGLAAKPIIQNVDHAGRKGISLHQQKAFAGYDWTYDINKDWSLTNRFAYTYSTQRRNSFAPYAVSDDGIAQLGFYDHIRTLSELATNMDLKGKFDTGPLQHKVLLGVDYLDNEITDAGCDFYSGPAGCGGALANAFSTENIYLPLYSSLRLSNFGPSLVYNDFWKLREYQFGVYGQDQISFADDRLHLLLGGRYDWARYGSVTSSAWSTNDPSFADVNNNFKFANDGGFSPNVGVVVQPIPWLSFYANYAQSFGLSNGTPAPGQPALPPQKGTQWEGGVKAELLDNRLVATFAYYDIHKTNILQQVLGTGYSIPIGEAESKGVEFDLAGRINDNWSAIATYTHDDALITEDQTGNVGHRLQNVPRNQGSLWLKYTAPAELRGLNVGAGLRAVGQRPGDDQNDFWVPAYATVDAFASYKLPLPAQYPKMTIQLNVNNLANARYYEASTYGRLAVYPGSPRTFLVSLRAEYLSHDAGAAPLGRRLRDPSRGASVRRLPAFFARPCGGHEEARRRAAASSSGSIAESASPWSGGAHYAFGASPSHR